MNTALLAQLHRRHAEVLTELAGIETQIAEAYEGRDVSPANETQAPPNEKRRPRRQARVVIPLVPPETTETDIAAAKAAARQRGILVQ